MLRDVLIIGTIVAVVIILLRLILGSPIIQRIRETFVSGSHTTNKYTECPPDSKMYMFQGKAFCCSGNIDYQADSAAGSCKTVLTGSMPAANNVFCTLGPTTSDGVVNCIETKAGLIQADEDTYCSPSMPTFAPTVSAKGSCCALYDGTTCSTPSCAVGGDPNVFNNGPNSCEIIRAQFDDGACPANSTPIVVSPSTIPKTKTVYGCLSGSSVCYLKSTLELMRAEGVDVIGLTQCSPLG
jgi:hypothetical protein